MDEDITRAGVGGDEAEAFLIVEPLNHARLALAGQLISHSE